MMGEKKRNIKNEKDWEEISKMLNLSAGDIVLMAGCGIIGVWWTKMAIPAGQEKNRKYETARNMEK